MTTSEPRISVALKLTGEEFSPAEAARIIGLNPSRTWQIGDSVEGTDLKRKDNGWKFALPYRETYDMDSMLNELLDIIEPYSQEIAHLAAKFRLTTEISFGVYMRAETPAAWFSEKTLRRVTNLGANLDIDLISTE